MKRALLAALIAASLGAQPARTKIVMLGTGTPIPDPERNGPSIAVVVDSVAYLFDAGIGVVRRAAAAGRAGVTAFAGRAGGQPNPQFRAVFLSHLHSDHTMGLPDAIFTPWIQGRKIPADVYGPPGTKHLVAGLLGAWSEDINERIRAPGGPAPDGWKANATDAVAGRTAIFSDERVRVFAFEVPHGGWAHAFGYRVETPDRTIVISGDTRADSAAADACHGCDFLLHEVYSDSGFKTVNPTRQQYHVAAHTAATALGELATRSRCKTLVLYHQLFFGASDERLVAEVKSRFAGRVISAKDLDVY